MHGMTFHQAISALVAQTVGTQSTSHANGLFALEDSGLFGNKIIFERLLNWLLTFKVAKEVIMSSWLKRLFRGGEGDSYMDLAEQAVKRATIQLHDDRKETTRKAQASGFSSNDVKELFFAANECDRERMAKLLSTRSSMAKFSDARGSTALHKLVESHRDPTSQLAIAKMLLDAGAVADARDAFGTTPLYGAIKGRESAVIGAAVVDENYFDTMKTAIISGRGFTTDDKAGARRGAVVNAEFANAYWPGQDPIRKRFRLNDSNGPWVEVVGVTKTNKYWFIAEPPIQYFYLPFAQEPSTRMSLVVETDGDPAAVAAPLREVVRTLDPNQPIYNVRTLSSFYEQRAISVVVMVTEMVAIMGLLGLTLALVGLYGLIAYSVSRRRQEIGIRIAIGASKAEVVKLVLRQGLALVLGGMLAGGAISFAVARMLTAGLVGLGTPNPLTYVVVPVALVVVTMAACYIPARRASLIDPIRALRYE
jgi:hypothetical protein